MLCLKQTLLLRVEVVQGWLLGGGAFGVVMETTRLVRFPFGLLYKKRESIKFRTEELHFIFCNYCSCLLESTASYFHNYYTAFNLMSIKKLALSP